jgi:alpha-mannosidase
MKKSLTLHLIANAHLDPVWQWDWREGLNEGLTTVQTMVDLLHEDPELTFIRGESLIYEHVERYAPATFMRMQSLIEAGRWDVVGGTYLQCDTNLTGTETIIREFLRGQTFFLARFGRMPEVAWFADSFGHSAGLPEILATCGIKAFAFTRPQPHLLPIAKPAFWWEGPSGARVMCYRPVTGGYCNDRTDTATLLDRTVEKAAGQGLANVGFFYGLGNHGGGSTRRQIADIRNWAAQHPAIEVVHSGLHRLFAALFREVAAAGENLLPTHKTEMNFCLRGCYVSMAKLKFPYRRMEAEAARTEALVTAVGALLERPPEGKLTCWDDVCFNAFHDILPGSSTERACDEQIAWLGRAQHEAQRAQLHALNSLAEQVDTRVREVAWDKPCAVPVLVWNPHPYPFAGHAEIEVALDYRPLWEYRNRVDELPLRVLAGNGRPLPFQVVPTEAEFMSNTPWRQRAVVPLKLPPLGWQLLEMGVVDGTRRPTVKSEVATTQNRITNGIYSVSVASGRSGIAVRRKGINVFAGGLRVITVADPWGSWGGMGEQPASLDLSTVLETWTVKDFACIEHGPERAALWVCMAGKRSRLELTFMLYRGRDAVDVTARVFWNERYTRLKLVMPAGDQAEFEVPGGTVRRGPLGEVPGGRWVRVTGQRGSFGFASDALYGFDCKAGALRASIVRSTGYTKADDATQRNLPWRPLGDAGELRFRFLLCPGDAKLPILARELEQPVLAQTVLPGPGELPRSGSVLELHPANLQLLALKPAHEGEGYVLRVQETRGRTARPSLTWLGRRIELDTVAARKIATWRLTRTAKGWQARRIAAIEVETKTRSGDRPWPHVTRDGPLATPCDEDRRRC